jgi:hypothetical protein
LSDHDEKRRDTALIYFMKRRDVIKSEFVTESYHCIPRISFQGWAAAVAVAAALLLPPAFAPMGEGLTSISQ